MFTFCRALSEVLKGAPAEKILKGVKSADESVECVLQLGRATTARRCTIGCRLASQHRCEDVVGVWDHHLMTPLPAKHPRNDVNAAQKDLAMLNKF